MIFKMLVLSKVTLAVTGLISILILFFGTFDWRVTQPTQFYVSWCKLNIFIFKDHIKSIHDKVKDFKCSWCDYASSFKSDLKLHIQREHETQTLDGKILSFHHKMFTCIVGWFLIKCSDWNYYDRSTLIIPVNTKQQIFNWIAILKINKLNSKTK